jgi:hypothetical protein
MIDGNECALMQETTPPPYTNDGLKKEADRLLHQKGLMPLLAAFGKPHIAGSYQLDLMSWRDLDIYLEVKALSEAAFFSLGAGIATRLQPVKMQFRNELIAQSVGLPHGWYWGIYLGNERAGAWKIDIWAVQPEECNRLLQYGAGIQRRLNAENREQILQIKSQCWQDPGYRKTYNSSDIYQAVLDFGIADIHAFRNWLNQAKR